MMRAMPSPRRLLRGATIAVVLLSVVLAASASAASPPAAAKLERLDELSAEVAPVRAAATTG